MAKFKLSSLYVSAKDFERAEAFYSGLFEQEPDTRTDRFVFYDLNGVSFGVFNPEVTNESIEYGNNCIVNLEIDELKALHDKLKLQGVDIVMPLQDVNDTQIFQCRDTEGNVLEFYRWKT